jgi:hypothetical protein
MRSADLTDEDRFEVRMRSAVILNYARGDQWEKAGRGVMELAERFDGVGIQMMLMGMADTMIHHQGGYNRPGELVMPMWIDEEGTQSTAEDVERADVRWAGQFCAARAAQDEATCAALVNSCAADSERYTLNILAVVEVTALTLNAIGAPR